MIKIVFALGVSAFGDMGMAWLHGLKIAAVAVVALAVLQMARNLCPDRPRLTLAILAAIGMTVLTGAWVQVATIAAAAIAGRLWLVAEPRMETAAFGARIDKRLSVAALVLFVMLLSGLHVLAQALATPWLDVVDSFFRSGALVFGGGHVLLPLLQAEVVPPGWVGTDAFLAGYGAAQAIPGPLFTFAAYLGTIMHAPVSGSWAVGPLCLFAIFVPSFLLVVGALPYWDRLCRRADAQAALMGVNAGVVGLLLAALYDPVWTGAVSSVVDFATVLFCLGLLAVRKASPWLVVILAATVTGIAG